MPENDVSRMWLACAEHSLETAQYNLKEGYYDGTVFHSQQAAESAIKGLLQIRPGLMAVSAIGLFPDYLYSLLSSLPENIKLTPGILRIVKHLDEYQVDPLIAISSSPLLGSKHPNSSFSLDKAKRAIEDASQLVDFCKSEIR